MQCDKCKDNQIVKNQMNKDGKLNIKAWTLKNKYINLELVLNNVQ